MFEETPIIGEIDEMPERVIVHADYAIGTGADWVRSSASSV